MPSQDRSYLQDGKPRSLESMGKIGARDIPVLSFDSWRKFFHAKQQNGRRFAGRLKARRNAIIARLCAELIAANAQSSLSIGLRTPRGTADDRYSGQRPS